MDVRSVIDSARFAPEKMQKVNLFATPNFFCDLYCLEPGQVQKPHTHDDADKIYQVLQGSGRFIIGDEERELSAHQIVLAPAGQLHGVRNDSAARLILMVVMSPNPNAG